MKLILGTMQFGERVFGKETEEMIKTFCELGYTELDTAYVYNEGRSECLIGDALENISYNVNLATKVNPRISGKLDADAVFSQFEESLKRMKIDYVNTLYLHFPDPNTPVESALEACNILHKEGKILELGLSNFPAWLVGEVYHICKNHDWILPTVYQGLYNPLSRHAERELNKALYYYGTRFYAYNPLAGGLLSVKYKDKLIKDGRFINRPNYQKRYWHESYFNAIDEIDNLCSKYGITITEAAYRWIAFHSMLDEKRGDGIIIGASSKEQLKENISYLKNGFLPEDIVSVINNAWNLTKSDAPEYFSFYKPIVK